MTTEQLKSLILFLLDTRLNDELNPESVIKMLSLQSSLLDLFPEILRSVCPENIDSSDLLNTITSLRLEHQKILALFEQVRAERAQELGLLGGLRMAIESI
ncbi:MAG: hypothetical protein ACRCXD_03055 [Luteolibacter sp.]